MAIGDRYLMYPFHLGMLGIIVEDDATTSTFMVGNQEVHVTDTNLDDAGLICTADDPATVALMGKRVVAPYYTGGTKMAGIVIDSYTDGGSGDTYYLVEFIGDAAINFSPRGARAWVLSTNVSAAGSH
jgi:hypothetical protein